MVVFFCLGGVGLGKVGEGCRLFGKGYVLENGDGRSLCWVEKTRETAAI